MGVSVKVTEIDGIVATGVSITYEMGSIPYAVVSIDPVRSTILKSDIEKLRKKPATIEASTSDGRRIVFNGWFDGLSMQQSPGGLSFQAVFKNTWQNLLYVYPVMPGVHPTENIFLRQPTVQMDGESIVRNIVQGLEAAGDQGLMSYVLDLVTQYAIRLADTNPRVDSQLINSECLQKIRKKQNYRQQLDDSVALLKGADVSACNNMALRTGNANVTNVLVNLITHNESSLWGLFIGAVTTFGGLPMVGNKKLWVLPDNPFLRLPKGKTPALQERNFTIPNIVYPAQYNNLSYSDNGYQDICACMITTLPLAMLTNMPASQTEVGHYIDDDASGGGLIVQSAPFMLAAEQGGLVAQIDENRNYKPQSAPQDAGEAQKNAQTANNQAQGLPTPEQKKAYAGWAQITYYKNKYSDRTGNVSMDFSPNMIAGTPGRIYSRWPEVYIDCRFTSVTHSISVDAPNSGSAMTNVSFNCGRVGTNPAGVETDDFFEFKSADVAKFQKQIMQDMTGS